MLNIDIIVKKTLVFAGLLISVFTILILPTLLIQNYILRNAALKARLVGLAVSGIIIIFTMRRMENFLINITDKYLFQKKYDYKELLKVFTEEVLTVLDLNQLVNLTVDKLVNIVRVSSCAVLLRDREEDRFYIAASHNIADTGRKFSGSIDSIKEILGAELVLSMELNEKLIGIIVLGRKKSDEGYSKDDMDILKPLARTLAIAISNAQLFEKLGETQAQAAQKEKMAVLGTLAAGMAHEIRNPITTIKIFAEYFKEKKDDPYFVEKFEKLVPREVSKINEMIVHLLEFSKPADYKSAEDVDLKESLNEVINILESEMVLNDIVLKDDVTTVSPIHGNKKYIQEILFNLIQNAIHAIGRRGEISISSRDIGEHVEVMIRDTGCGISPENINHIFEPFFTTKMDAKGVGLGLYVIKQLMTRMDGVITVESEAGKGTTFRLRFRK